MLGAYRRQLQQFAGQIHKFLSAPAAPECSLKWLRRKPEGLCQQNCSAAIEGRPDLA